MVDDIAHHPVHTAPGPPLITICLNMLYVSGSHQLNIHGPIINGGHHHTLPDQLPGPATGSSAQIHSLLAASQVVQFLARGQEHLPRFFQFQRRSAGADAGSRSLGIPLT